MSTLASATCRGEVAAWIDTVDRGDPAGAAAAGVRLSHVLWEKGIGNALRIWDGFAHDWPVWHQMVRTYIGGHD